MNKYDELLEQETKRLEAKQAVAQKKAETKKEMIIDFLTKLNPFLVYLNENFIFNEHSGDGSLTRHHDFPVEYSDYGGEGLHAEFDLKRFIEKSGDMTYGVEFTILSDKIKIECDNNFKLNITWGWDDDNNCRRVIECVSDIEGIAMKQVARLLKRENEKWPRSYFRFDKK